MFNPKKKEKCLTGLRQRKKYKQKHTHTKPLPVSASVFLHQWEPEEKVISVFLFSETTWHPSELLIILRVLSGYNSLSFDTPQTSRVQTFISQEAPEIIPQPQLVSICHLFGSHVIPIADTSYFKEIENRSDFSSCCS